MFDSWIQAVFFIGGLIVLSPLIVYSAYCFAKLSKKVIEELERLLKG